MATNANAIKAQLAATTAPYEAQLNNLRLDFEAAKKRQAADNAARLNELYIAHEQNKRTLPQQNAALGNTGGLTETSIIDLANTYQRNRNAQNKSYTDAIAELDLEYAKSRNTINAQIAAAQAAANAKLAALNSGGKKLGNYTVENAQEDMVTEGVAGGDVMKLADNYSTAAEKAKIYDYVLRRNYPSFNPNWLK